MSRDTGHRAPTGYRERLWPGPLGWTAAAGFALFAFVALLPVSPVAAGLAGGLTAMAAAVAGVLTSPVVTVQDGELHAGRARIPAALLGPPTVLDRDGLRAALGPGSDARTFAVLRAWVPGAVQVPVRDPQDRTPAWLVSTRRPTELAAALERAGAGDQAAHSEQMS